MGPCHVLFVDDEHDILELVRIYFAAHQVAVIAVGSGDEALATFPLHPIKIVISDMRMPRMSGLRLLRELQNKHSFAGRYILSSGSFESNDERPDHAGVHGVLTKPLDYDELARSIKAQLGELA